jgi:DNA-binding transcriptional LysR family regulator
MPQHRRRQFLKHGTLPQMAAFEAIVRLGSFARAAQEMHMAQPTVSGLVRKLADSAGAPLFEKVGRRAVPTAAGRALFETAGEVFAKLERAGMEIAALRNDVPATGSRDDSAFTSRRRNSLGGGASSETRKNGIPNQCVPGT